MDDLATTFLEQLKSFGHVLLAEAAANDAMHQNTSESRRPELAALKGEITEQKAAKVLALEVTASEFMVARMHDELLDRFAEDIQAISVIPEEF